MLDKHPSTLESPAISISGILYGLDSTKASYQYSWMLWIWDVVNVYSHPNLPLFDFPGLGGGLLKHPSLWKLNLFIFINHRKFREKSTY